MRVAVASDDGRRIAQHTGRCRSIVVFEIGEGQARRLEVRENRFTAHAQGECRDSHHAQGAGHRSHAGLVEALADCAALITRGLGPRLVVDLRARGIDAFVSDLEEVDEAADRFARGTLKRIDGTGCDRTA